MPNLAEIATFMQMILDMDRYPAEERGTMYVSSARPIRRIGLALEPWPTLPSWLEHEDLDAIFLHRPFNLDRDTVPPTRGVIYAHLPFDERLTVGYTPRLAEVLGLRARSPMGDKGGRPQGMVGELPRPISAQEWRRVVVDIYGGTDEIWEDGPGEIRKVAIVNAMTPALVQEAANRGVQAYLTGQLREPVRSICKTNQVAAYSVGQRRAELWGLRTLAGLFRERWATVRTAIFEDRGQ
jgi:putative NIF3 family GTP cyclohydrolase 1 type 2